MIRKTTQKDSDNHHYLYECEFIEYPNTVFVPKERITSGSVTNHEINNQTFIGKEFPQSFGESLKVIKKSSKQDKEGGNFFL